jgi:hypothetical protein
VPAEDRIETIDFSPVTPSATIGVMSSLPLQFLLLTITGWMTRDHQRVTEYLVTENAVLRCCASSFVAVAYSTRMLSDVGWLWPRRSSGARRSSSLTAW